MTEAVTHQPHHSHWHHPLLSRVSAREPLMWIALAIFASGWITFSLPNRAMPGTGGGGLDAIALMKLATRGAIWIIAGWLMTRVIYHRDSLSQLFEVRLKKTLRLLTPWIAFFGWAVCSFLWSPLKSVSIGQAIGLGSMLLLTTAVAVFATTREMREQILVCLNVMFVGYTGFVLVCHLIAPDSSGLLRDYSNVGAIGIVHPTAAGANASLGLMFAVWNWLRLPRSRSRTFCSVAIVMHVSLLLLAQSRTSLAMGLITVAIALAWGLSLQAKGKWVIAIATGMLAMVLVDPGFVLFGDAIDKAIEFVSRGQSSEDLKEVSGRAEMWSAIWHEFQSSIWIGHGYFVTSAAGKLDVWHSETNYTAHNIYLQLLVSTGIVGTAIFAWGAIRLLRELLWPPTQVQRQPHASIARELGWLRYLMVLAAFWYAGWTITCISFLGPVSTDSVFFFSLVGLCIATHLSCESTEAGALAI
ncbi:O-antigen ligase family protein [Rubripirellula amarantea]|nr:O-antigen ligase family protein [Rubripirellula amarantea]